MRVLHVIPSISLSRGGPSVVLRTMARSQASRGLEVHVATTDDDGAGRLQSTGRPFVEEAVTYRLFRRQTKFYTFSLPLTLWLWRHARDYDVIHIHALFSYPSIVAALCATLAKVPYLVRPLGVLGQWGMRHRRPWLKSLSFQLIESRVLRNAAGVQYTSEQEAEEALRLGVKHIALVIPNPVDIAAPAGRGRFRAAYPAVAEKTIILFLSRIDAKKGIDLLLPAFARLKPDFPNVVLILAGEGNSTLVEGLKEEAHRLGLDDDILWVGFLQGDAKQNALADADIFVLPSYSENFGVSVVEAMTHGLPVIVSDQVGLHVEITKSNAGIVIPCEVSSLSQALRALVSDAALRRIAAQNGRALATQFSPDVVCEKVIMVYSKICSTSAPIAAQVGY
jgi:glycosyltransferase involved in cell wall biosynthesis